MTGRLVRGWNSCESIVVRFTQPIVAPQPAGRLIVAAAAWLRLCLTTREACGGLREARDQGGEEYFVEPELTLQRRLLDE